MAFFWTQVHSGPSQKAWDLKRKSDMYLPYFVGGKLMVYKGRQYVFYSAIGPSRTELPEDITLEEAKAAAETIVQLHMGGVLV